VFGLLVLGLAPPSPGKAQLISPGKLSSAHAELEGMSNCTQCHQLRTPGADRTRCLQCHKSLSRRVEAGEGYHGTLEEKDCGTCHKEHLGEDFHLVRMDPDTFPHASTGYALEGAHQAADCRACHTPQLVSDPEVRRELEASGGLERSYLGLDSRCGTCHTADNPHAEQFIDRDCGSCHTEADWEEAVEFDHSRTSYPLDGQHTEVDCVGCHEAEQPAQGVELIRYTPMDASDCATCHDDPHDDRMTGRCGSCHVTAGWSRVNRSRVESTFDHEGTGFPLAGAHERAECRACHAPLPGSRESSAGALAELRLSFPEGATGHAFPKPEHETCTSCHVDTHEGIFEERACDLCHTLDSWVPPDYDRARHEMELRFELSGSHAVTPCSGCHESLAGGERRMVFRFQDPGSCSVCHQADDPHEGVFQRSGCDGCHGTERFAMDRFDHALLRDSGWTGRCSACHETDDPHSGQFQNRDCQECHNTEAYAIEDFDHSSTRFQLEGAHVEVACSGCHLAEKDQAGQSMTRYRPLDMTCEACHGGGP